MITMMFIRNAKLCLKEEVPKDVICYHLLNKTYDYVTLNQRTYNINAIDEVIRFLNESQEIDASIYFDDILQQPEFKIIIPFDGVGYEQFFVGGMIYRYYDVVER